MAVRPGLRERKKQRTRAQIVESALELFDERGFERTTIAEIADRADIAPRTFFSYFSSKDAVVFHDFDETLARFEARLAERAPPITTFDVLRVWIADEIERLDAADPLEARRRRLIRNTPILAAGDARRSSEFRNLLQSALASDLGEKRDALRPLLVAAAAAAALEALDDRWVTQGSEPAGDPLEVFDEAVTFLEGGLAALRRRP